MEKVFLITKLKTTNLGNQALSEELIKLFVEIVGKDNLTVEGRPIGLLRYNLDVIKKSADPVPVFERWVDAIVSKYNAVKTDVRFEAAVKKVDLISEEDKRFRYERYKLLVRKIKKKIDSLRIFNNVYKGRLDKINSCSVLVYGGAGEVGDNGVFLRQLIELRVAQKLGKKTAAVNQSVVVRFEPFKKLLNHVYGKMTQIVVRGTISRDMMIGAGVAASKFIIAPDTAIRTSVKEMSAKESIVALNFTPNIRFNAAKLKPVIELLKRLGYKIVFVTNEPYGDKPVGDALHAEYGIEDVSKVKGYKEYAEMLAGIKYQISTRLHSCILGLAVGTPCIPIEGNIFKTKELFAQLEYPMEVIDAYKEGWEDELMKAIDLIENNFQQFTQYMQQAVPALQASARKNADWLARQEKSTEAQLQKEAQYSAT